MGAYELICDGMVSPFDFAFVVLDKEYYKSGEVIMLSLFNRSKVKVKSILANLGKKPIRIGYKDLSTASKKDTVWHGQLDRVNIGRDQLSFGLGVSSEVGVKYIVTTNEDLEKDFYSYCMNKTATPNLQKWSGALLKRLIAEGHIVEKFVKIFGRADATILHNDKEVRLDELRVFDVEKVETNLLDEVIPHMLATKEICISEKQQASLGISESKSLDLYLSTYSETFLDQMEKELNPLVGLKSNVDNLALKYKSLFPQQAACIEGVKALRKNGSKFAVLNEEMGTGKSIQGASAVESMAVEDYMKKHPGATLQDVYRDASTIKYRCIIMCPSHLVNKWAEEIESEIPYSKAIIIKNLAQLAYYREAKVSGKEFFIISKDTAKLGTTERPIPSKMKKKEISLAICKDCLTVEDPDQVPKISYKKGGADGYCPICLGKNFKPSPYSNGFEDNGVVYALSCPECGEILLKNGDINPNSSKFSVEDFVLTPKDFSGKRKDNKQCYHCGAYLWTDHVKPVGNINGKVKESPWYKVVHYINYRKKNTKTAFVLREHEEDYLSTITCREGVRESRTQYGPRRYVMSEYIKKYLKFDFCILDECHKYLGDQSSQGVAAHGLVKASKFSLLLTGTLSNGTAGCFYQLFWMLDPKRMIAEGYRFSSGDLMNFCKKYGCVETAYEGKVEVGHKMSRGRALGSPKVRPGISPVLFGKFLVDCCLFLSINDMSKYLPLLHERVELVPLPEGDIVPSYNKVLDLLAQEARGRGGMAAATEILQFGLSYLDKPYGRTPITHPFIKDAVMANPRNFNEYSDVNNLLPKEERLISIVQQELSENRNVFVFATFTGKPETNVTWRLKEIIEHHCNLKGQVAILESKSPSASERENYIHKLAEKGIKVIITNVACCETGLDFRFKYNDVTYNYPTIIFYQVSYVLSVLWQASRRAYRLNQTEECRTYYFAYENTAQSAAVEIMARKIQASSAISGKFSSAGLAAMAKGVDARTLLAQKLAQGDLSSRDTLDNMFDVLEALNNAGKGEDNSLFKKSLTFYELVDGVTEADQINSVLNETIGSFWDSNILDDDLKSENSILETTFKEVNSEEKIDLSLFRSLIFGHSMLEPATEVKITEVEATEVKNTEVKEELNKFFVVMQEFNENAMQISSNLSKKKKKSKNLDGQLFLF